MHDIDTNQTDIPFHCESGPIWAYSACTGEEKTSEAGQILCWARFKFQAASFSSRQSGSSKVKKLFTNFDELSSTFKEINHTPKQKQRCSDLPHDIDLPSGQWCYGVDLFAAGVRALRQP